MLQDRFGSFLSGKTRKFCRTVAKQVARFCRDPQCLVHFDCIGNVRDRGIQPLPSPLCRKLTTLICRFLQATSMGTDSVAPERNNKTEQQKLVKTHTQRGLQTSLVNSPSRNENRSRNVQPQKSLRTST